MCLASAYRSAMTAPRIQYADGSPPGLLPMHSTSASCVKPMSNKRRRMLSSLYIASTCALQPGKRSDKVIVFISVTKLLSLRIDLYCHSIPYRQFGSETKNGTGFSGAVLMHAAILYFHPACGIYIQCSNITRLQIFSLHIFMRWRCN